MSDAYDSGKRVSGGSTPRWVVGVLLLSLMANMIVVGAAAGRMWAHHGGHGWFDRQRHGDGMQGFLRDVPDTRRAELAEMIRANRAALREEREKVRELRKVVREAMVREPFDKAALESALGEVNTARQALGTRVATELANFLERLTPDERKAFVEKGMRRRGGGRDGKL